MVAELATTTATSFSSSVRAVGLVGSAILVLISTATATAAATANGIGIGIGIGSIGRVEDSLAGEQQRLQELSVLPVV